MAIGPVRRVDEVVGLEPSVTHTRGGVGDADAHRAWVRRPLRVHISEPDEGAEAGNPIGGEDATTFNSRDIAWHAVR